jgi:hypothetical protein
MTTLAKRLGYQVGDFFISLSGKTFSKGEIVEFSFDDGSSCPLFKSTTTGREHYQFLDELSPAHPNPHVKDPDLAKALAGQKGHLFDFGELDARA